MTWWGGNESLSTTLAGAATVLVSISAILHVALGWDRRRHHRHQPFIYASSVQALRNPLNSRKYVPPPPGARLRAAAGTVGRGEGDPREGAKMDAWTGRALRRASTTAAGAEAPDVTDTGSNEEVDVVVIGSGLGGLSAAALLAQTGRKVVVCEAHDTCGGAAHGWERHGYHFESGPSLYSGLAADRSPNPMKNVLQVIGEEPEWLTYDRWGTVLPEGTFAAKIGPEEFEDVLRRYGGPDALDEWKRLTGHVMAPGGLGDAAQGLSSMALREDAGAVRTVGLRYPGATLLTLFKGRALQEPFGKIRDRLKIKDRFVNNWLDMLCFLLQGVPAEGTLCAVIAYMLADWYRPGVTLDFPKGGSGAIVDALVRGIEKNGGKVLTNTPVDSIVFDDDGRAAGVRVSTVKGGNQAPLGAPGHLPRTVFARQAVVSNADATGTRRLVERSGDARAAAKLKAGAEDMKPLRSFIHLHAGIDAAGLPSEASADFPAQWAVVRDWDLPEGVEAPRNVVLVSMPSLIDPSLAPEGKHVIHAYTPATEPYEDWAGLERGSAEYKAKKEEAADFLWKAVEEYVPNARARSDKRVEQIGTPLTHERFLRRGKGSYGPRAVAGQDTLPGHKTGIEGLWMCGDYTFPGIGVPAAASSGAVVAHTIMSTEEHIAQLELMRLP